MLRYILSSSTSEELFLNSVGNPINDAGKEFQRFQLTDLKLDISVQSTQIRKNLQRVMQNYPEYRQAVNEYFKYVTV